MKLFSIYFPQFYPVEVNDKAWGHNFTDWTLVARANMDPLHKRRSPLLGHYDGASVDVQRKQVEDAKQFGLTGFAIYHYWFYHSHQLDSFEKNISDESNGFDFPWFLVWATESWSKRWVGSSEVILSLSSAPSDADMDTHCEYLAKCFSNKFYYRINNLPVYIFYNISHFDDPEYVLNYYRKKLTSLCGGVFLGHFVKNAFDFQYSNLVDITYIFEPRYFFSSKIAGRGNLGKKIFDTCKNILGERITNNLLQLVANVQHKGTQYSAKDFMSYFFSSERKNILNKNATPVQNVISPGWNNFPRYGNRFTALENLEPKQFSDLITSSLAENNSPVLINAWNEWSESAAIEPCAYLGNIYLDEIKKITDQSA